jgi:hypothetical protein
VLTHNATILTVVLVAIVVAALNFGPGEAAPPQDTAGLSANDAAQALSLDRVDVVDNMDPTLAGAVALAKERAYKEQLRREAAARKLADKRRREAMIREAKERERRLLEKMKNDPSVAENKAYAKALNAAKGWGRCWPALETIWTKESTWNERAENPSSGAYGIPQALPGSKMASAGADWRTNAATQIKWGLSYIGGRYGDPCKAWGFWQSHHWY